MKYLTLARAREIASHWHGGQWSALYSFASTGKFHVPHSLEYFKEIWREIEAEYFEAREVTRSNRQLKELHALKRFLLKLAKENEIEIEFFPSEYGYTVPYLAESVSEELTQKVTPVTYMK